MPVGHLRPARKAYPIPIAWAEAARNGDEPIAENIPRDARRGPLLTSATAQQPDLFELQLRPSFASRCYSRHGPEQQFAGLRLDSKDALLKGGKSEMAGRRSGAIRR